MKIVLIVLVALLIWIASGIASLFLANRRKMLNDTLSNNDVLLVMVLGVIALVMFFILVLIESLKKDDWKLTKYLNEHNKTNKEA